MIDTMTAQPASVRGFSSETHALQRADGGLALALAPGLTDAGWDPDPQFFSGFATQPLVLARGLLALADVTATRYFQYVPTTMRDPVLSAHGDRLRAETFSACNGVYARLDLLASGFDGGEIARGTTNVDLGAGSRAVLAAVRRAELLHLSVGGAGLTLATPAQQNHERPVVMPDRWVRALGNVAELHRRLTPRIDLNAVEARGFLAAVPAATASGRTVWLARARDGIRVSGRPAAGAVGIAGLHRLSAAKRLLPHVTGLTVYGDDSSGASAVEIQLPGARLSLGLTAEPWRGHSGEGALLSALAGPEVSFDAERIAELLAFEPRLDIPLLARRSELTEARVRGAVAVLAAGGRVGWDLADGAYFHREVPTCAATASRDQPRLAAARTLVALRRVVRGERGTDAAETWTVLGVAPGTESVVRRRGGTLSCSCAWGLRHGAGRGPCKHELAVTLSLTQPLTQPLTHPEDS